MAMLLMLLSLDVIGLSAGSRLALRVDDPAASVREDLAAHLAPDALVHLRLGGGLLPRGLTTPLDRIAAEPETEAFLAPLRREAEARIEAFNAAVHATVGTDLQELLPLLRHGVELTFYGFAPGDGPAAAGRPVPDLLLTLRRDPDARPFADLLAPLREAMARGGMATFEDVESERGPRIRCALAGPGAESFVVAPRGDLLVIATRASRLDDFLARRADPRPREGLSGDPRFAAFARKCLRPGVVFAVWTRPQALESAVRALVPREVSRLLAASGLTSIETLGYAAEITDSGVRERVHVVAPAARGLVGALLGARTRLTAPATVPGETAFFCDGAIDVAGAVEGLAAVLAALEGRDETPEATWKRIGEGLGFDLRDEIVARLGPEVALSVTFPGRSLLPTPTLVFGVPDPEALREAIERLTRALRDRVRIRSFDHEGTPIHLVEVLGTDGDAVPTPIARLRPSFVLLGDRLLVTAWPQAAKAIVNDHARKRPPLAARADFAAALERLGGTERATWIHFMDLPRAVGFLWDNGAMAAQTFLPSSWTGGLDTTLLPLAETVTQHLGPSALIVRPVERGLLLEATSSVSMLGLVAQAAIAGSWLLPASRAPRPEAEAGTPAAVARAQLQHLRTGVQLFILREGRLPRREEWPTVLVEGSPAQKSPYVSARIFPGMKIVDPWGHPYEYVPEGLQSFRLVSRGADGKPGGRGSDQDLILRLQ